MEKGRIRRKERRRKNNRKESIGWVLRMTKYLAKICESTLTSVELQTVTELDHGEVMWL